MAELQRTIQWIKDANYEAKIVIAGNHDVTLDPEFYAEHGSCFHKKLENSAKCIDILKREKYEKYTILFLNHESAVVKLTRPEGPRTVFKIFGSPFSRFSGRWAFRYDTAEEGEHLWSQVPSDADIIVTHTPPFGYCDRHHQDDEKGNTSSGCKQLLNTLRNIRPILSICGHVHESRGYERIQWDGASSAVSLAKEPLPPINSKKQSLIDLTGKKQPSIRNLAGVGAIKGSGDAQLIQKSRQETCIINAAILAKSWPHVGGKQFNRPIVVDVNLPVCDENDEAMK
ncbi:hypothetical protein PISL3812_02847 [Talaromyces islandicus]|uniref:Calcineurin-like phosphoesterase domain-containing protein n=1 Tax=Talaromyces islandicus TaxID=28573 RepID=A0A0U1LRE5_TALIS|nr:hypothetical protein PISL3812_02847 [Talaromyces islandicus]